MSLEPAATALAQPPIDRAVRPLTDAEFRQFQSLIEREVGIYLSEAKKALLVARLLKRVRELGLTSFGAYHEVATSDPAELTRLFDAVSTNETRFFREPRHFDFLRGVLLPQWRQAAAEGERARRVRVLSAGCSSGEECYSLAMLILDQCPPEAGWEVEILGLDLSTRVLDRARSATWPIQRLPEIPPEYRKFLLRGVGTQEGLFRAAPEIRAVCRFERFNLTADPYRLSGLFDLVFCRNVLIYFKPEIKAQTIQRLSTNLAPDGYLFLGHAEGLLGAHGMQGVIPTVYRRRALASAASGGGR